MPLTKACRSPAASYIRPVTETQVSVNSNLAAVKNHSRTYEDFVFVYPVISRRSRGLSIGVNLNPDKVCNFDCIYCEVDRRTPPRALRMDLPLGNGKRRAACSKSATCWPTRWV